jgi:hypothetical protein
MPVTFILAAPVFLWLYEAWMRNEISGEAGVDGEREGFARRHRRVRRILAAEIILVTGLAGIGHALLGLDWNEQGLQATIGTIAGALLSVVGCALALSSELGRRRYQPTQPAANGH